MDSEELKKLFTLYNYKLEQETEDYIVFSYSNPYPAVEIVPVKDDQNLNFDEVIQEYKDAGYGVKLNNEIRTISEMDDYLYDLFFHVNHANQRSLQRYKEYTKKVMNLYNNNNDHKNTELKKYQYIDISYDREDDFFKVPNSSSLISSILSNINENGARLIIVEAAAGFGKTTTAYEILKEIIESNKGMRPFFMELSKDRTASNFRYLLLSQIEDSFDMNLKAKVVIHNIQAGKIPLILDGFDELLSRDMDKGEQDLKFKDVETMLSTIAKLLYGQAKVILTTRKTAIFSGDTFYEWFLKHTEKSKFKVRRYQLKEPEAKDWLSKDRLKALGEDKLKSLENPVLLGYLRYIDDDAFDKIKKSNGLLKSYFDFILKREQERQSLPFTVEEQLIIFERLSSYFANEGISSDKRSEVKAAIALLSENIIKERATVAKDFQTLTNALTNHALLDRKENNNVGFINDFIFVNLLTLAIKNLNDENSTILQNDISYTYLKRVVDTGAKWTAADRLSLHKMLQSKCKLNEILNFWADVLLKGATSRNYSNLSFDGEVINESEIGNTDSDINNCTFSNIVFRDCSFDFTKICNCTFINCDFEECIKEGSSQSCGFYNCIDNSDIIEKVAEEDNRSNELNEFSFQDFARQVLGKYFQVGSKRQRMMMISKLRDDFDKTTFKKHFKDLVNHNYIKYNGDKSFITNEGVKYYNSLQNE